MPIPSNYTFVVTYTSTINAQKGSGVLIGTPIGGAAVVDSALDLKHNDIRYVIYEGIGNVDNPQIGAIKFILTPNYSGAPASIKVFWAMMQAESSQVNLIELEHATDGNLIIYIAGSTAGIICTGPYGVWNPVAGTDYEIEFNYDLNLGVNRLFINGALFGVLTGTGTRSSDINRFNVGTDFSATYTSDFSIKDIIVFNTVQHTTSYEPGYCLGWADETIPGQCLIYGFLERTDYIGLPGLSITATASELYNYGNLQVYGPTATTTSGAGGYWEINLIESVSKGFTYNFVFKAGTTVIKEYDNIIVPVSECIAFNDLIS